MLYILIFVCLYLYLKLKTQNKKILELQGQYDSLCNVLAGEINVTDVKNKLEGLVEHKALDQSKFPLTLKQLDKLRKIAKKYTSENREKQFHEWKHLKHGILPYTIIGFSRTKTAYIKINDSFWEITDSQGHPVLKEWGGPNEYSYTCVLVDSLQVSKILQKTK